VLPTVFNVNGEIRAEQGTQATIETLMIIANFGGMVPIRVCASRHADHPSWAELDTEAASFAPFLDYVNDTAGYLDTISI
jgi:hypothetical protein